MRSSRATSLSCLYDSIQSSTTDCRRKKEWEEKKSIKNAAARTDLFNVANRQRLHAITCMALLPSFTTSNNIMFSMPFSWWWPFIRPAPFTPLPFSPAPFFPFFPPWNRKVYALSTLTTESFKKTHKHLKALWVSLTFPLAAFVLLPSRSSEKSVSDEKRVSVSLLSTTKKWFRENSDEPSLRLWNSCRTNYLLREGEFGWYLWCCYHFCNIFWITSTKDWRVLFKQYQTGGLACDLKFGRAFFFFFLDLHTT